MWGDTVWIPAGRVYGFGPEGEDAEVVVRVDEDGECADITDWVLGPERCPYERTRLDRIPLDSDYRAACEFARRTDVNWAEDLWDEVGPDVPDYWDEGE